MNVHIYMRTTDIHIHICHGVQRSPLPPSPPMGKGSPGDAPPVGCGVDRGDAHGIHRVSASHMVMPPPPLWDVGWSCIWDEACNYACMPCMHM